MLRIALFVAMEFAAFSQTTSTEPRFEVATMKVNRSGSQNGGGPYVEGTRFIVQNVTLRALLRFAYRLPDAQISGPDWMDVERYDVVASVPEGTSEATESVMLRDLLAERMRLRVHKQDVEKNAYVLSVAKGGAKLRATGPEFKPVMPEGGAFTLLNGTMAKWSEVLAKTLGRPVLDRTGISGTYIHMLTYASESSAGKFPDIFTAIQEQLGLRLDAQKATMETIVMDRADRVPSEN